MSKFYRGDIRISFSSGTGWGGHEPEDYLCEIGLTDKSSLAQVVTLKLRTSDFAMMMAGRSAQCDFEIARADLVGKRHQNKEVFVPAADTPEEALRPFCVEGWRPRKGDYGNGHRGSAHKGYTVVFFRHVDAETGEPAP